MSRASFGYDKDGLPIELELEGLRVVQDLINTEAASLREASDYLQELCGRSISHVALRKRLKNGIYRKES
jgi:isoleucyl-tRNA synthetase